MAEGGEQSGKATPPLERQNTEDVEDLPLKIPVASFFDHFRCPICMASISKCCMTTCGHRFCFKCIEEWVDRSRECAVCKTPLRARNLIKDTGHDSLLKTVRDQRKLAEKEYFKNLVDDVCDESFKGESSKKVDSPLQLILQKHLKQALQQHETYHQQLIADYRRGLIKLSRDKEIQAQRVISEFPHDPEHPERLQKLAQVEAKWNEKKTIIDQELEKVEKMLANTFDRYLTDHLPPPSIIPLDVKLSIPDRKFSCNVVLKPQDSMETILKKLKTLMEKENFNIVQFPTCEEFNVSIISPFAPVCEDTPGTAMATGGEGSSSKDEDGMVLISQVVHPECRPVLEYDIRTGTELRFTGKIVLDSDVSNLCFAATYVSGQSKTMNYFMCKNCNIKWVCQPCIQVCHKGHESVPFISNHKPSWACCHCPKKKQCMIQGNKQDNEQH